MLDHTMEVQGWKAAWIERRSQVFHRYSLAVFGILGLALSAVCLRALISSRHYAKRLQAADISARDRAAAFTELVRRAHTQCRGQFYIANLYLLNVIIIAVIDAYVSFAVMGKDASEHPDTWNAAFVIELVLYSISVGATFIVAFIVAPVLQIMVATWALTRFARKRGISTLSGYIPEARLYSTNIGLLWTMTCFLFSAYWPPLDKSLVRWIVLEGCLGSALAWLDASFAFNFCSHKLDVQLGESGIADVARMFSKTISAAHAPEKSNGDGLLPRYQETPQDRSATVTDEKASQQF